MLHVILRPPFDELQPYIVHDHVFGDTETTKPKCVCVHFEIDQSTEQINIDLVESVWADEAELVEIIKHFEGIPKRFNRFNRFNTAPTMKWFGDDAKFIVANWT